MLKDHGVYARCAMTTHLLRITLADQVRDYVVVEIAHGRLAPGTPLRELDIAERLGTSQTPVREAFRMLAAVGLLENRKHVGTRVRDVTAKDLSDAVPVRAALEGIAGRIVASRGLSADEELEAILDRMEEQAGADDRLALARGSTEFHRRIVALAGNDSLLRAWNALGIEVMTLMALAHTDVDLGTAAASHRLLYEALRSGQPDRAASELAEHQMTYVPTSAPLSDPDPR
jgi:DNA-binding GntR family transcriptional regulator